jgi:hypothetical protein
MSRTTAQIPDVAISRLHLRRFGGLLLPFLVLAFIHVVTGLPMEQPIILADEVGYLGNARYLSGTAHLPDMRGCQFYHFGYSLILLPAFWLFSDPVSTYKAAIAANALLMSALYFPLYWILRSFVDVPRSTARGIAFTCCLYPPLILYSNFAWSENAFIPFYALALALFGQYLHSRSARDAILFGLVVGFLYTIHPRALPILVIVLAHLSVLALMKVVPRRQAVLGAATMGLVFGVTRAVNEHLKATGWGGGGEFSATKLAGRLLPGSDFPLLLERASGQLLYLAQATHGLFLLGLIGAVGLVLARTASGSRRRVMADPRTGVSILALTTAAGVFIASCTTKLYSIHGGDAIRGTEFIHGRYNEAFAVVFVALALAELCGAGLRRRRLVGGVLAVIATTFFLTVVVASELAAAQRRQVAGVAAAVATEDVVLPSEVEAITVPAVFPLVGVFGELNLYFMSLAAMASFLLIAATTQVSRRGPMLVLMLLFGSFSFYNHRHFALPAQAKARPRLVFASQISRLGPIESISYDDAHFEFELLHGLQYLLPNTVFDRFDSHRRERPRSEVVLSSNRWGQATRLGARFVVSSGWDNALWVLPGEMQSRLSVPSYEGVTLGVAPLFGFRESGFHLPEDFGGAPGRWTKRVATLRVPLDPLNPPRMLGIETVAPGRDGARLQLLANGIELWHGRVPSEPWSKTFSLGEVPMRDELLIKLKCDTFSPAESGTGPGDGRRLGVAVTGIWVTAGESFKHRRGEEQSSE